MPIAISGVLDDLPLVFFDLETTGLDLRAGHRVCELALLRVRGAAVEDYLGSALRPDRLLDPEAAAVNGFQDAELRGAPRFASVAGRVQRMAHGAVLIAHNLPFDMAFLNAELARIGQPPLASVTLDTLVLARRLLRRPSYSLAALAEHFGLPRPTHRALADVLALRGVFAQLQLAMAELGVTTLQDVLRLERGLAPGVAEPNAPAIIAQALAEGRALTIRYRSRSSPESLSRTVRPIYLTNESYGVCLRAYCELRQNIRTFVLDKIEAAEIC
ncbi:DNA polymerase III, epsilon subunit [Oscillochloris trichoides DG-6]|uniref:DNA polymerase III, epsilon subunit n=1 Tax=Oscillochloris trichoides DG-6 TaxID=765420 RepID=E1IEC8_9CHLR|nr:3'-5' exonuclease [Oscillochloris trichoides]EFO80454.1 DNA polymerase III, epsilon subunit [Oscillochloris trichoides DG-6]